MFKRTRPEAEASVDSIIKTVDERRITGFLEMLFGETFGGDQRTPSFGNTFESQRGFRR